MRRYAAEWTFAKPSERYKHEAALNDVQAVLLDAKHAITQEANPHEAIQRLDDAVKMLAQLTPHAR